MTANTINKGDVWDGMPAVFRSRVVDESNAIIAPTDIASIGFTVLDRISGTEVTSGDLEPSDVMLESYSTAGWTKDSTGYNFRHLMDGDAFPTGGHIYRVEYKFQTITGRTFPLVFEVTAQDRMAS